MEANEDLILADLWDGDVVLLDEAIDALVGALDEPLLLGLGDRHVEGALNQLLCWIGWGKSSSVRW